MRLFAFIYGGILMFALFFSLLLFLFQMAVTHVYTREALDASTDAGSTMVIPQMTVTDSGSGQTVETTFILDQTNAVDLARNTFNKELANMQDLGLNVDEINQPTFSFPSSQEIDGTVTFQHDFSKATEGVNRLFDTVIPTQKIDDSAFSTSKIRKGR